MRLAAYAGVSTTLAAGVVLKALHQRANFYSACVYLSQSNANLMILTNLCLLAVGFVLYGLQRLLYGPLRPIETEQLYEKAWFAVTETCLAMTTFRGELGAWFLVMFVCLLVGKIWGWIGEGRVEILEQQLPNSPRLFHTRLALSLILSVAFNVSILEYAVRTVLRQARPDMMVMFGFEFAILSILSTSTAARYSISLWEIYITRQQRRVKMEERRAELRAAREEALQQQAESDPDGPSAALPNEDDIDEMELDVPGWEEKGRWVFYLELITDFLKLVVYVSFFAILFNFYGLPIHILRDVVLTMRSFGKRVVDFLRYRNATRDMNERYPDATADEIEREDTCIICREEMRPWEPAPAQNGEAPGARPAGQSSERLRPKKLPCGHILHLACLRSWLERQQNCPTCRRPVATAVGGRDFPAAPGAADGAPAGQPDGRANVGGGPEAQPAGANEAPGANGQPGAPRPRAWFLNFGPLRIGFGAGRGDMFQNMAQQIHQGQPAQPGVNQNIPHAGPRGIGFGFGFGRPAFQLPQAPLAPANTQFNLQNTQAQLHQIEQQISHEINNLRATAEQLQVVRLLQGELARLRAVQSNPAQTNAPTTTQPPATAIPPATTTTTTPTAMASSHIPSTNTQRQFTSNPQVPALGSGDIRLPDGLTLPQGWTLLPLQRVEQSGQPSTQTLVPPTATNPSSSSAPTHPLFSAAPTNPQPHHTEHLTRGNTSSNTSSPLDDPSLGSTPIFPPNPVTAPSHGTQGGIDQNSSAHRQTSPESTSPPLGWTKITPNGAIDRSSVATDAHSQPDSQTSSSTNTHPTEGITATVPETPKAASPSKGKSRAVTVEDYIEEDDDS
ncbi:E3 ubiquitin-protein ligase hrd1 [Onygenales sp. PD_40]|nr:E3 ubiquitin-protein ligase hrd1 [Onygenales sp. PD_40]KAK2793712.1 E3 ubiquitin-protein ligase hrd1 [Onygenales sp. PD_12]KAK2804804.1 E3 ubiquitin-protein ligase hrd1 [Onygenales sp. PD_10]